MDSRRQIRHRQRFPCRLDRNRRALSPSTRAKHFDVTSIAAEGRFGLILADFCEGQRFWLAFPDSGRVRLPRKTFSLL